MTPGSRLGRYQVIEFLGRGGMGEVYRARDPRLGRDVAIKILLAEGAHDPDRLRRFEHEARAAGQLHHPNLLAVFDIDADGETTYLVTELLEGETLRAILGRGAVSLTTALDYARQIADGLIAAHDKGVVHRDLKPENLFVTRDGSVKILDFGLAKLVPVSEAQGTEFTQSIPGAVVGTIGYIAPEQILGQRIDSRTDLFAFGAIVYEMLAGRRAFHGESPMGTVQAILQESPPPLTLGQAHHESVAMIAWRCLEKAPERRFQSARELMQALDALADSGDRLPAAVLSPRSSAPPSARHGRRLRRAAAVLGGAMSVAAVLYGVFQYARSAQQTRIESVAVLPLDNLSQDDTESFFAAGLTDALTTELSKISALRVVSRTSAMQFKQATRSATDIARELNVDGLVQGSVMRAGGRVRVTAQLIDAASDTHLWADTYERELSETLMLQRELVGAIARRIQVALTPEERSGFERARPIDPAALEAYFRGRFALDSGNIEGFRRAEQSFQRAMEIDAEWGPAYAGLADAYMYLGNYSAMPPERASSLAKSSILKALSIDDTLAEAHTSLGDIWHNYEWDQAKAESEYRRAIDLNPSSAAARAAFSFFLMKMGRYDEAAYQDAELRRLDPLSPSLAPAYLSYFQGRFADAANQWRKHVEQASEFELAHFFLIASYVADHQLPEALRSTDAALKQFPDEIRQLKFLALRGVIFGRIGRADEARQIISRLLDARQRVYVRPVAIAQVYASLGDTARTLEWLDAAVQEHDDWITWSGVEPSLDLVRGDPRFERLLERLGIPDLRRKHAAWPGS